MRPRNKDKPWFDDQCRRAFDLNQEAHLRWTRDCFGKSLFAVKSELMKHTRRPSISLVSETSMFSSPQKWWTTLKSAVFGSSSSLPALVGPGGGLVCKSVGKADLLSDHFDSKQSRESVDLLVTCHPSPSLITFAFRSSEVKRPLLDLDPYGGTDPLGMFPLFLKRMADVLAPRLSVVFDHT